MVNCVFNLGGLACNQAASLTVKPVWVQAKPPKLNTKITPTYLESDYIGTKFLLLNAFHFVKWALFKNKGSV